MKDYDPNSIDSKLTRMESKLDVVLIAIEKQDARIRIIENIRYWAAGVVAIVTFAGAWMWKVVTDHLIKS